MRGGWKGPVLTDDHYRQKLKSLTKEGPNGCWEWQNFRHHKGYGLMNYRGKQWRTHRLSYTLHRGPIPAGMVICHTCDNPPCCNPLHLFLGTFDINNKDMAAKGRCKYSAKVWTHCKHGHEFTPENTFIDGRGFRKCRTCDRIRFATPEYKAYSKAYAKRRRAKLKAAHLSESV